MSLIEGIDDEVVLAVGTFAVVSAAVILAWRSTRVYNPFAAQQQPQTPQPQEPATQGTEEPPNTAENDVPPTTGQAIKLKLKFLNDTERVVDVTEDWTIGQLKRVHLAQELDGGRRMVRLVFRGHELADIAQKISECQLSDMSTIHCLVSPVHANARSAGQQQQQRNTTPINRVPSPNYENLSEYDEVGRLLMPLLTIVLGCVWYARIRYRSLFDGFSSLALIAFTLAFLAAVFAHFYRLLGFGQPANNNNTANTQTQAQANSSQNNVNSSTTPNRPSPDISEPAAPRSTSDPPSYPPPPYSASDHTHSE